MSSRQNNHLPARGSSSLDNPPSRGSSSGSGHGQGAGAGYGQGQGESKWASAAASIESDYDGQRSWEHVDDEPEDFDSSSWLDRKTKKVQNDSLNTSRRALEKMENAQGIAQSNLSKLASQSEQLSGVEKRLQETDSHVRISEAKTDRLKALNRFFMLPAFGSKSAKRREESLTKQLQTQKDEETAAGLRDMERRDRHESLQGQMQGSSRESSLYTGPSHHSYSTPEGLERDNTEEEIDGNLNKISSGLSRLKMMGRSMNDELDAQKDQVSRIQDRTDTSKDRMNNLNRKMNSIANRR